MLISEYLQARNISVTTGNVNTNIQTTPQKSSDINNSPFAQTLRTELEKKNSGVEFSKHALDRIEDRNIDMTENNRLSRLNKAVEIAQQKGSDDAREVAAQTMDDVRRAMRIDYFEDAALIQQQADKFKK